MLTCKNCIFNQISVGKEKEMQRVCTRRPPSMYVIPTQQGVIVNVSYPIINDDFIACGEYYEDGDEEIT